MNIVKTAEHLTRRSFKRKIIAVGVSLFSALALFATGFASWVISSDATREQDGIKSWTRLKELSMGTEEVNASNQSI